jgi:hypothetical protein
MKDLGMSWKEIKETPRYELQGILSSYHEYNVLHAFDGYNASEVAEMAKNKPEVRSQYNKYITAQRELKRKTGQEEKPQKFNDLLSG